MGELKSNMEISSAVLVEQGKETVVPLCRPMPCEHRAVAEAGGSQAKHMATQSLSVH